MFRIDDIDRGRTAVACASVVGSAGVFRGKVEIGVRQENPERLFFAGVEGDSGIDGAVFRKDGGRMVSGIGRMFAGGEVERKPHLPIGRKVFDIHAEPLGAAQIDSRFAGAGEESQTGVPFGGCGTETIGVSRFEFQFGLIDCLDLIPGE